MADTPEHRDVDPERTAPRNAFDHHGGYSGQAFDRDRAAQQAAAEARPASPTPPDDGRDIPPETGRRAFTAPNGEVHGSGANAGGGGQGENFDDDAPGEGAGVPPADRAPDR
ncbi:hypothetical protein QLH51_01790 [Sphingomonas sp. 2R-10]|uniref:hypothetical protein n=1 Tax=Sphingomonas sp. 2R-10 TaxID=3045148 RepID=UPI000F794FD8|nr:hypothetical protein [Sphingomonas sp. 2R-10]MDJ0275538.1 hypothetical protein [Sphingomonas sp. 2R-10]